MRNVFEYPLKTPIIPEECSGDYEIMNQWLQIVLSILFTVFIFCVAAVAAPVMLGAAFVADIADKLKRKKRI